MRLYIKNQSARLPNEVEAAQFIGLSKATLSSWRSRGGPIPYYRISNRIRYNIADLQEYLEANRYRHTGEYDA